jgi:hypothetical protein
MNEGVHQRNLKAISEKGGLSNFQNHLRICEMDLRNFIVVCEYDISLSICYYVILFFIRRQGVGCYVNKDGLEIINRLF